ncbi:MAG: GNAT family N-acetyltransferase [Alphaproteobacteria bacterium]|nr:GNAT family N-acetyltransferase [Alphaproteobacteria bacterium]
MITAMSGADRARFLPIFDSMFELRHEVFVKRLGWPLKATDGREIDQFDHDDTHYLVLPNTAGDVVASCRMTMTTRPNLLSDVFPIWSSGRPCRNRPRFGRSVASRLIIGASGSLCCHRGSIPPARFSVRCSSSPWWSARANWCRFPTPISNAFCGSPVGRSNPWAQ